MVNGVWSGSWSDSNGASGPRTRSCGSNLDPSSPSVSYSSENIAEATAALISRVVGLLPAWGETWTGTCSAYRNLSPDESSYSIRRFKWRLRHSPNGTCYLKVWLRKKFQPEGGGEPTYTSLPAYEWTGSGNPCIADPDLGVGHEDNEITSSETSEDEPATDGTVTIEIIKYSCVPGYTPPDDGSANGYPDPAAE